MNLFVYSIKMRFLIKKHKKVILHDHGILRKFCERFDKKKPFVK